MRIRWAGKIAFTEIYTSVNPILETDRERAAVGWAQTFRGVIDLTATKTNRPARLRQASRGTEGSA